MKYLEQYLVKMLMLTAALISTCAYSITSVWAAPPVRVAVVSASGSGIEQEVVDRITNSLNNIGDVAVSTVNPDWYIVCNITEQLDPNSGSIRYNGSVITKTAGGQILNTVAVQKYNQDFSVGGSTQLNKKLVDNAARDVINSASQRVVGPLQNAIMIEMQTRERIIRAQTLADAGQFDEAIGLLRPITPDTPHFKDVRRLIDEFEARAAKASRTVRAKVKPRTTAKHH